MYNNITVATVGIRMHVGHIICIHQCFSTFLPQLSEFSSKKVKTITTRMVLQDKQRPNQWKRNNRNGKTVSGQFSGFIMILCSLVACCDGVIYLILYKINSTLVYLSLYYVLLGVIIQYLPPYLHLMFIIFNIHI